MNIFAILDFTTLEYWLVGIVLLLLFVIWRLTHHEECGSFGEPEGTVDGVLSAVAGICHSTVEKGNKVAIIQDTDYFQVVVEAIADAQYSVHLETFLWQDGEASEMILEALTSAAKRGVKVRVIVDARGSSDLSRSSRDRLREAGCEFFVFHKWKPMNLGRFNIRTHRKIVIIDGTTAFVGGHCITDSWLKTTDGKPPFHDLTARLQGPVVNQVQSTFAQNWTTSDHSLFLDEHCFPEQMKCGEAKAHVASLRPDGCPSAVQILYHLTIGLAKKSIFIQNPYFLPDPAGAEALSQAARRGVDVRIMTPSVDATDTAYVTYAGQSLYDQLLENGVRIFEYQPTLLHQKTIAIDGVWCGIGSANFDDRSFEINDEIVVGIEHPETVAELERIFREDEEKCKEIDLEEWRKRPFFHRLRERLFYLFNEQF